MRYAEELVTVTAEHGFHEFWAWGIIERGWCLAMLGREAEGIEQLARGLAALRAVAVESRHHMPFFLTLLADAHRASRAPEEGLKRLAEAAQLVEATGERWAEAEMHLVRGKIEQDTGNWAAAETSFQQAIEIARRQDARLFELCTTASLAQLWRDQGKRAEARGLLAPIYGWFTEGFDTPDLKQAKALLDELA